MPRATDQHVKKPKKSIRGIKRLKKQKVRKYVYRKAKYKNNDGKIFVKLYTIVKSFVEGSVRSPRCIEISID